MLKSGDIVLLSFPHASQQGNKYRPAAVVSGQSDNSGASDVQIAYMTAEVNKYGSDVFAEPIDSQDMAEGALHNACVVRADKITTVPASECRKVGRLSQSKIDKLLRRITAHTVEAYAQEKYVKKPFIPGTTVIPPSGKDLDAAELKNMVEASLDGWLTTGRFNDQFEKALAAFIGIRYALTVNSGSSANLLAFATLTSHKLADRAIKPGDEVIGVAAGFPTTINPILQCGAVPVFVDVELGTYNIDANKIEAAITPKTKAIMLAHTLGNPYNLDVITGLCQKHNLWLIEDCCDALGTTYTLSGQSNEGKPEARHVGTFGDIATLSFYPAHHITMGEGGAVFTNNGKLKQIAESIRDWGRDCYCAPGVDNTCKRRFCQTLGSLPEGYDHKYTYSHLGYNLKISDMQAACGLAQLGKAAHFIQARKNNFAYLKNRLQSCADYLVLPEAAPGSDPSWFGFPITVKTNSPVSRLALTQHLDKHKIGTRLLFAGNLTRQPYMEGRNYRISGELANTDIVMNNTFWIGVQPALTQEMLEYAVAQIEVALGIKHSEGS
jgi:CDP-6-deoxy-D-xylo-4-hexulose-3-dehydrase